MSTTHTCHQPQSSQSPGTDRSVRGLLMNHRWSMAALSAILWFGGCAAPEQGVHTDQPPKVQYRNLWLQQHLKIEVRRNEVNPHSGLREIDAEIAADKLEAGRESAFRIVARTKYTRSDSKEPVDVSAWSEILLSPERSMDYQCTSLQEAEDFVIEVAYPEEVGLQ